MGLTRILATWIGRNPIGSLGAHLVTKRSIGLRSQFLAVMCPNPHPESRRTIPEVYMNRDHLEYHNSNYQPDEYKLEPKVNVNERRRLIKKYSKALRKHPTQEDRQCFTDQYRWTEFRRKLIYGTYDI